MMRFWLIATMTVSIGISFADNVSPSGASTGVRVQTTETAIVVE
jgi:hypothetical protein